MSRGRTFWSVAFAAAAGMSLAAQTTLPGAPSPAVDPSAPVTITGCLKAWTDGSGEPVNSPSASRAAAAPQFTLSQLERTPASISEGTPKPEDVRLLLLPAGSLDVAAHVNTKVTVTGIMLPDEDDSRPVGTSGRQAPSTADGRPQPSTTTEAHAYERIRISSIVAVADTCSLP